jgi:long-chain acyl-CoA synthetase
MNKMDMCCGQSRGLLPVLHLLAKVRVNIYPRETENLLVMHPEVADAAVIGVLHPEMGEEVKPVIQPKRWDDADPELASRLIAYCRANLSPLKCPRSIDFDPALPRHETGKLYKPEIRKRYWP